MVEINNLTTGPLMTDEGFLRRVAEKVLKGESASWRKEKDSELSIALIGQGKMRKLNKKYRGKNRVTDVLAFGENSKFPAPEPSVRYGAGKIPKSIRGLGEIVICLREVKKNAKRYETIFEKELAKVLIHGILHLLGYEHEKSEEEAKKMRDKENYYLSQI